MLLKVHPQEKQNPLRIFPRPGHLSVKGTDESDKIIYVQNINDCFLQTHFLKSTDKNSEEAVRAFSMQPSPVLTAPGHGAREAKYQVHQIARVTLLLRNLGSIRGGGGCRDLDWALGPRGRGETQDRRSPSGPGGAGDRSRGLTSQACPGCRGESRSSPSRPETRQVRTEALTRFSPIFSPDDIITPRVSRLCP